MYESCVEKLSRWCDGFQVSLRLARFWFFYQIIRVRLNWYYCTLMLPTKGVLLQNLLA